MNRNRKSTAHSSSRLLYASIKPRLSIIPRRISTFYSLYVSFVVTAATAKRAVREAGRAEHGSAPAARAARPPPRAARRRPFARVSHHTPTGQPYGHFFERLSSEKPCGPLKYLLLGIGQHTNLLIS